MTHSHLLSKIDNLKGTTILVVGDIGLDEYVMGVVRRISPEAPVPVVEVTDEDVRLGLAANVAQNITSLEGDAILVAVVGQDDCAKTLTKLLKAQNVNTDYLVVDDERPTTRKLRVMSGQHHVCRVDFERKKFLSEKVQKTLLANVEKALPKCGAVVLQDYAKGVLSESSIQSIISLSKKAGKRVLVDPYRSTPAKYYFGADLMTPNYDEALILSGRSLDDIRGVSETLSEVGNDLKNAIGSNKMVITRGKDGVSLFEDNAAKRIPTFARQVFDVTGAGDTFIAALSLAWTSGLSLEESCLIANYAAGVVVGKVGCVPCSTDELVLSIRVNEAKAL